MGLGVMGATPKKALQRTESAEALCGRQAWLLYRTTISTIHFDMLLFSYISAEDDHG
jgi:hypothetical protein